MRSSGNIAKGRNENHNERRGAKRVNPEQELEYQAKWDVRYERAHNTHAGGQQKKGPQAELETAVRVFGVSLRCVHRSADQKNQMPFEKIEDCEKDEGRKGDVNERRCAAGIASAALTSRQARALNQRPIDCRSTTACGSTDTGKASGTQSLPQISATRPAGVLKTYSGADGRPMPPCR